MFIVNKIRACFRSKNENALAFFNLLGPVILNGINFFTVPIFTRLLGTENYGIVSVYTTWVQVFTIILGIQTSGTIATSKIYFKEDEWDKYNASVVSLSFCSFVIVSLLCTVFIGPLSRFFKLEKLLIAIMILQSFGAFVVNFASIKFTYNKEAQKTFLLSILVTGASIFLSIIFIQSMPNYSGRYWGRILGGALPNIVIGAVLFLLLLVKGRTTYHRTYWKFCLPLCLPLIFHGLSHIILSQSDKVMLQQFTTNSLVGIYGLVFTFTHILNIVWNALNNTWVPFYYDYVKNGQIDLLLKKTKNYIFLFTSLSVGFILVSPEVLRLLSTKDFWAGEKLIPVMVISIYMVFLYSFPVNFQFYHKNTKMIAIGTCSAALVNVLLNLLLIPLWDMMGAAIATAIAYILLFLFHQYIASKKSQQDYHYTTSMFFPGIAVLFVTCGVFYLIQDIWILRWALAAGVGVLLLRRIIKNRSIF